MSGPVQRFGFAIDPRFAMPLRVFGVRADTAFVEIDDDIFSAHFGWFRVTTPVNNITSVQRTGPFLAIKALGPRMSAADRGVTFGSSTHAGVCVTFGHPVTALFGPVIRHPGLTVTVADPDGLVAAVQQRLPE